MSQPGIILRASRGWQGLGLKEVWRYRELVQFFTLRSIRARYRQMAFGPLWIIIQPLVNGVVFSVLFGTLAKLPSDGVPYPLFTYTAILPWTYFATAVRASSGSLVAQMNVISKVYFPRLVLPLSAVLTGLVDFAVSFLIVIPMMLFYGVELRWQALAVVPYLGLALLSALGVGLWTATASVRFRDVQLAMGFALQVWMYATPVAYSSRLIPEKWLPFYRLNPMYWVVDGFRWALLDKGHPPDLAAVIPVALVTVAVVSGAFVFRRTERKVVDLL